MSKILVTGGAGFIGSHLCERLVKDNNEVFCFDNLFTGRIENIAELNAFSNFHFINGDVIDEIILNSKVDQIYNLACPASPVHYQFSPVKTLKTSFLGALHVLELAKKNNARVLQASTSEVYGDPAIHPQPETYWGNVNPNGLRSCYDEGKRVAETLFFDFHREYGVDIKIVRIFNTYGPKMKSDDGRVVSNFIVQALNNRNITVYGDGTQTRSFCYVDDTVDALIRMMNSRDEFTGPVNIGNPSERTMLELATKIIELTESKSKVIFEDLPSDDPKKRKPIIELAKAELGWQPIIDINEGLSRTIDYFQKLQL